MNDVEVALTLDDYPLAQSSCGRAPEPLWSSIAGTVRAYGAPATWFVIAGEVDESAAGFLDVLAAAGAGIGNHTARHLALTSATAAQYLSDIDEADRILQPWLRAPKLFRYPFLREGEEPFKQKTVRDGLAARGYVAVPASIAPRDWEYDAKPLDDGLVSDYVEHVQREVRAASRRAYERLGRDIPHILVLHVNALNAVALPRLLAALSRACRFIGARDALADAVYRQTVPCSEAGLTLLEMI